MRKTLWIPAILLCAGIAGCSADVSQTASETLTSDVTAMQTDSEAETVLSAQTAVVTAEPVHTGFLSSPEEIALSDTDGGETNYTFTYQNEVYQAIYTPDNWKIVDSYRITDSDDILLICEALRALHPIHGADLKSYRDAADMAYEWEQHNLAYQLLSDDSPWKLNAKDVDINPADQGKSVFELYQDRL